MNDSPDIEQWKREVLDAMTPEERRRIMDEQREYKRAERRKKYEEYLLSDQWKLIRRLKIEEARGMCEVCSSRLLLQVHHRTYDRLFRESLADLTVLCDSCHSLYEINKRLKKLSA